MILKFIFAAIIIDIDFVIQSLPREISNKGTGTYKLYLRFTGPSERRLGQE